MFDRSGNERQTSSSGLFDPRTLRSGTVSAGQRGLRGRQRRPRDGMGGMLRRVGVYAARDRQTAAARIMWGPVGGQATGGTGRGRGREKGTMGWGGGTERATRRAALADSPPAQPDCRLGRRAGRRQRGEGRVSGRQRQRRGGHLSITERWRCRRRSAATGEVISQ